MSINLINYALAKKDWKKAYEDLKVLGVGGRNLLPFKNVEVHNPSELVIDINSGLISGKTAWYVVWRNLPLKKGETYTFYAEKIETSGNRKEIVISNETQQISIYKYPYTSGSTAKVTFTIPDTTNEGDTFYLAIYVQNGGTYVPFRVEKPKLEKGDRATDWTPAPEDTNAHPFVVELAETVFRSKQNEERIRNLENAITALGGGS